MFCSILTSKSPVLDSIQLLPCTTLNEDKEEYKIWRGQNSDIAILKEKVEALLIDNFEFKKEIENFQTDLNEFKFLTSTLVPKLESLLTEILASTLISPFSIFASEIPRVRRSS